MMLVELENVHFNYGAQPALRGVSLSLEGGCLGLLGANGAGKSTLLKILLGWLRPHQGTGHVLGCPLAHLDEQVRRQLGYLPESECFLPGLSGIEYVALAGILQGLPRAQAWRSAHRLLDLLGLEEARYRRLEEYSTGMKQRLKLAQALVHRPCLLLLDEPTSGLDPAGREALLDLLQRLSRELSISMILSTHIVADVERICDRVVVLRTGQVVLQGTRAEFRRPVPQQFFLQVRGPIAAMCQALQQQQVSILEVDGQTWAHPDTLTAPSADWVEAKSFGTWSDSASVSSNHTLRVRVPENWASRRFFELAQAHQCTIYQLLPDTSAACSEWFQFGSSTSDDGTKSAGSPG